MYELEKVLPQLTPGARNDARPPAALPAIAAGG